MGVVLFNHGNEDFKIAPGDRIAQLICEKIIYPELEEVDSLDNTDRGEGGFGSTGKDWDFCILSIKFYLIKIMSFLYIILKKYFLLLVLRILYLSLRTGIYLSLWFISLQEGLD